MSDNLLMRVLILVWQWQTPNVMHTLSQITPPVQLDAMSHMYNKGVDHP